MDQLNSANKEENSNQAKLRRRRNDQNNRDYTCGCGKSYLSYAALYTHLKQKHDSKAPDGTILPNNLNQKPGRGRPRRPEDIDKKSGKSDDGQSESENDPDEALEEMLTFLDNLGNYRQAEKFQNEQEIQTFLITNFPIDLFSRCQEYQSILEFIKDLTNEKVKQPDIDLLANEEFDREKALRKTCINKILAYFLIQIGPKLTIEAYKEMSIYIIFYSKALNSIGYQAVINYQQEILSKIENKQSDIKEEASQNTEYCDVQNGEHILLIANEFILQLLPQFFIGLGPIEKQFKIFGSSDEKLKNAVYVTQHLSYWLYSMKFTNSRLALYTDDD